MSSLADFDMSAKGSAFKHNLELLRGVAFFSGISLEPMKVLAYLSKRITFGDGEFLQRQGEIADRCYYIVTGRVEVLRQEDGHEMVLKLLGRDAFLGGLALLGEMKSLFSVRVVSEVVSIVLERDKFRKAVEQFPEITPKILDTLVRHIFQWEENLFLDHGMDRSAFGKELGITLL